MKTKSLINFRASVEDHQDWLKACRSADTSISEYCREMLRRLKKREDRKKERDDVQ